MSDRLKALLFYLLARIMLAPVMLWLVATVVFLLMRATPGDPVDAILGPRAPIAVKEALREQLGLTGSLLDRYLRYANELLHLDLGKSLSTRGQPVWEIIQSFFPATAELALYAMAIAIVVGVGVGIATALRPNTPWDVAGRLFGIATYALPMFWVGMLLQLLLSVQLGWFPIGARYPATLAPPPRLTGLFTIDALLAGDGGAFLASLHYLTLPALTLGVLLSGMFERIVRANLKQALRSDYVEAAIARGVHPNAILFRHALKNALIPVVTIFGLTLAALLGGAVLTEVTFSWPGLANRLFEALVGRDYPVVQGIVVFFAAIVAIASIAIDAIVAWIDPRVRY